VIYDRQRHCPTGIIAATVAAAGATIAGWMRIVGQVTPVPKRILSVACP